MKPEIKPACFVVHEKYGTGIVLQLFEMRQMCVVAFDKGLQNEVRLHSVRKGTFKEYFMNRKNFVFHWSVWQFYVRVIGLIALSMGLIFGGMGTSIFWYVFSWLLILGIFTAIVMGAKKQFQRIQS